VGKRREGDSSGEGAERREWRETASLVNSRIWDRFSPAAVHQTRYGRVIEDGHRNRVNGTILTNVFVRIETTELGNVGEEYEQVWLYHI
jgi:hypothetical protein